MSFIDNGKLISDDWDSIVVVDKTCDLKEINSYFTDLRHFDKSFDKEVSCLKVPNIKQRVIYSFVGDLGDYDDCRSYFHAASKGIARAISSGSKAPVVLLPESKEFETAALSAILGAFSMLYVPIQHREFDPKSSKKVDKIAFYSPAGGWQQQTAAYAKAIESGRNVARDIGGGDPERMTAAAVLSYVTDAFVNSSIKMQSILDPAIFVKDYPLFGAVNRCAAGVERHAGRIVFLEYRPPKPATKTVILVNCLFFYI